MSFNSERLRGLGTPQKSETYHHENGHDFDSPVISLDVDLDKTIEKSCEPKEPLEESRGQNEPHDRYIHDLTDY